MKENVDPAWAMSLPVPWIVEVEPAKPGCHSPRAARTGRRARWGSRAGGSRGGHPGTRAGGGVAFRHPQYRESGGRSSLPAVRVPYKTVGTWLYSGHAGPKGGGGQTAPHHCTVRYAPNRQKPAPSHAVLWRPLPPGDVGDSVGVSLTAGASFNGVCNRQEPLWQPPPTACPTASRATSEVPSLVMHPWGQAQHIPAQRLLAIP